MGILINLLLNILQLNYILFNVVWIKCGFLEVYVKQNIAFECKIGVVNTPLVWKTVLQTHKKVLFMGIHIALTHTIQDVSSPIYKLICYEYY